MQPPPPPPPLNIPPSRARRQLAARLALHSKQNAESNGDDHERSKGINPFADGDDIDDSDEDDNDFTVGDLEAEEEGKGHLPPGTGLEGSNETVNELLGGSENVGQDIFSTTVGDSDQKGSRLSASWCSSSGNPSFPSLLHPLLLPPSTGILPTPSKSAPLGIRKSSQVDIDSLLPSLNLDTNFFLPQNQHHNQTDSDSSSEDENDAFNSFGASRGHKRRLSSTTEAKRRTSIEDDDDDEVVHVKMDVADVGRSQSPDVIGEKGKEEDGELIEIRHGEMQGVESSGKKEGEKNV